MNAAPPYHGLTPSGLARIFCLLVGPALALNGLLGLLFAGAEFEVGDHLPHHSWNFFFEFNGWHEVLHIATGLMLTVASFREQWAPVGTLAFGVIYAVLTPLALLDGDDVANLIFSDARDNAVHALLGAAGIALWLGAGPTRARSSRRSPRPRPRSPRGARR